jgi:hypothetical protein
MSVPNCIRHAHKCRLQAHFAASVAAILCLLWTAAAIAQVVPSQPYPVESAAGAYVPPIDRNNKDQVANLYQQFYYPTGFYEPGGNYQVTRSFPIPADWTGNTDRCIAGDINAAHRQASTRQINYLRRMAGVGAARTSSQEGQRLAQAAALIVGANAELTHYPAPTAKCYSQDGADGSRLSNLLFAYVFRTDPRNALVYIGDAGDNNTTVGHRSSLLFPGAYAFGYASTEFRHPLAPDQISGANAIYANENEMFKGGRPIATTKPDYVMWPSAGFVPSLIMPASSNRWSISCSTCDFTNARVTSFKKDGVVQAEPQYEVYNPVSTFDPTFVFRPFGVDYGFYTCGPGTTQCLRRLDRESTYEVTVSNVVVRPGCDYVTYRGNCPASFRPETRSITWSVTVFDPVAHLANKNQPAFNVADLWWNAQESGWGLSLAHGVSGTLFATWFTYGSDGKPMWYVMSGCVWEAASQCRGTLYRTNGTPVGLPYQPADGRVTTVGTLTLKFTDQTNATMQAVIDGVVVNKTMTRQPIATEKTITDGRNFTGLWNNDPAETGWGIAFHQQYETAFAVAYVYGPGNVPLWFVMPGGTWSQNGPEDNYEGPIYTVTGPPVTGVFNTNQVRATAAGTAKLTFKSHETGTVSYTLNGVTVTKELKRYQF